MTMDLDGKVALVTGGNSGISLDFAVRLLELGCKVLVADIAFDRETPIPDCDEWTPPQLIFKRTDVTDVCQLEAAFETAIRAFGRLDFVCPAAGLSRSVRVLQRLPHHAVLPCKR